MSITFDEQVRKSRKLLQNPYAYLDGQGHYAAFDPSIPADVHDARRSLGNQYAYLDERGGYSEWHAPATGARTDDRIDAVTLLGSLAKDKDFTKNEILGIARRLQGALWKRRKVIWPARDDVGPNGVLDPTSALISIGYSVRGAETLGQYRGDGELFEIAGLIDNANLEVQVSNRFSPEIRRFTVAHELGHAILHTSSGLHRDRALDGTAGSVQREPREAEADLFASYFLLPEKLLRDAFRGSFLTQRFALNEETAFALTSKSLDQLQSRCRTVRDLARLIATANYYNGIYFDSLASRFGVSNEAMAIRLEELGLIVA